MTRIRCLTALAVMSMLVGSKQGYPTAVEKKSGKVATYRGGYVITYDPASSGAIAYAEAARELAYRAVTA